MPPTMKDRKQGSTPSDPYRREPPVIDLPKGEFASSQPAVETSAAAEEPQTAIEPIAATGLDGAQAADDVKPAEVQQAVTPTPDEEIPQDGAAVAADSTSGDNGGSAPSTGSVPPVAPRPAAAAEKRGTGGLIAASLVGGVVGAAFTVGADVYWRQPPADYESRLAALETRPRPAPPVPSVPQPANEALDRRIATLEAQTRGLSEAANAARTAAEASQKQVADLANRPAPERASPASAAPAPPDPAIREGLDRLGSRLEALEGRLATMAPAAAIDELRASLQNVQSGAEERNRAVTAAIGAVQATTTALNQRLEANSQELGKLSAEVGKLPPTLLQAGLRSVVAGQIGQNLRAGLPLGAGLSALERLGASGPALDPLRPYAAQPAPSAAALAAEFKPIAEKIMAEPQGPAGSIADRLLRIADKVVTVKAVGDGSGRDVPGLVGRIESALSRGALPEAAAAWDSLPDEPKRLSAEWGIRLKARIAADNAAQKLGADSLAALDAPSR
jgi:hypothetical protein